MGRRLQQDSVQKQSAVKKSFFLGFILVPVVAVVGLHTQASAFGEETGPITSEFSSARDPLAFAEDLAVLMPAPVVALNREDAVAQVLLLGTKTMTPAEVMQVARALNEEASALGYDPLIFVALIRIESNFNHLAISPVGAEGLMQLMPPTAAWMADRHDMEWPDKHSFDPVLNVRLGARYLAHLNRRFRGHMDLALTAYNRGPTATRYLLRKYGELPKDIRDFYATKVLEEYRDLRATYGHLPVG